MKDEADTVELVWNPTYGEDHKGQGHLGEDSFKLF